MHEDPTPRDDARAAPDGHDAAPSATSEAITDEVIAQVEAEVAAQDAVETETALAERALPTEDAVLPAQVDAVAADPLATDVVVADADAAESAPDDAEPEPEETIGATGVTLEELSAYFDRGRTPRIAALEHDAEARALLDSMERLDRLSTTMADEDAAAAGELDEQWLDGLLGVIRSEVKAGRDLPIEDPDERTSTTITEGALREIARTAGDGVDGVLDVRMTIAVRYGGALVPTADAVRDAVHRALVAHAPMSVGAIDVVVDDVLLGATR